MIDLHTHSTASDGTLSPEALVELAAERGLSAIAITDHDTVAGVAPAQERGDALGVEVIPAVELGASLDGVGEIHLLGYFIDIKNKTLRDRLAWLRDERRSRGRKIVERLNDMGVSISVEQVVGIAQGGSVGRPHIARALVENGHVASMKEAFERYLKSTGPAYVKRELLSAGDAIGLVREAGGVAVLAHPCTLGRKDGELPTIIQSLMAHGLRGIEVFYSQHTSEQVRQYEELAQRFGLLVTGGSDFHGANKPEIALGRGHTTMQVPAEMLTRLRRAADSRNMIGSRTDYES